MAYPSQNNARCTGRGSPRDNTGCVFPASTGINAGDLLYIDSSGNNQPAINFPYLADLPSTQAAFKQVFAGVSEVKKLSTDTTVQTDASIGGVYTFGEFTFPCAALGAAYKRGTLIGPDYNAGGPNLLSSQVVPVNNFDLAIGVTTEDAPSGATQLTFQLLPTLTVQPTNRGGLRTPTALTGTSATLTGAQLLTKILTVATGTAGAGTYTLPTGTLMQSALPFNFAVGDTFDFSLVNISTTAGEVASLAAGTGFTIVGNASVAINSAQNCAAALFLVVKTAANTFVCYRVS